MARGIMVMVTATAMESISNLAVKNKYTSDIRV